MKKIITFLIVLLMNIQPVFASSIGCIKFNVDTSRDGFPPNTIIILHNRNDPMDNISFNMDEYGNEWTYFVNPGTYYIEVKNKYPAKWNMAYPKDDFTLSGDDNYECNIKIIKLISSDSEDKEDEVAHHREHAKVKESKKSKETKKINTKNGMGTAFPVICIIGVAVIVIVSLFVIRRR